MPGKRTAFMTGVSRIVRCIFNTQFRIYLKKSMSYSISLLKSGKVDPKKVIIKLSKQRDVNRILKTKYSMKKVCPTDTEIPSIYVNQNLYRYYKLLWLKCKTLSKINVMISFGFLLVIVG